MRPGRGWCWVTPLVLDLEGIGAGWAPLGACFVYLVPLRFSPPALNRGNDLLGVVTAPSSAQLSATDVSARATMKGAAKCDKHCEFQNSVNQQELERTLRFRDIPESMPASVSTPITASVASCG